MRVLSVSTVHYPGDARVLHRQIKSLVDAGHHVTWAAPWSSVDASVTHVPDIERLELPRSVGRRRLAGLRAARSLVARVGPEHDVVIVHDPELVVAIAGLDLPPVVYDVKEDTAAALFDKEWLPRPLRSVAAGGVRALERMAESRMLLMLAETAYAERFEGNWPLVPNEAPVPQEQPDGPSGDPRVVYLGRVSRGRGADELLELATLLPLGVRLEVLGWTDPALADEFAEADRDGILRWWGQGWVANPVALDRIQGAVAGLSLLHDEPNYRHSRPTKVAEYMSRAVPVITTPNREAVRMVGAARCGLVVPFGDPEATVEAVNTLLADPASARTMGLRGHRAALERYDWNLSGPRFVTQLEKWACER